MSPGIVSLTVAPGSSPPARKPRGRPDCGYCLWSETGVCGRHGYDPLASLGITRQAPEDVPPSWLDNPTFYPVL